MTGKHGAAGFLIITCKFFMNEINEDGTSFNGHYLPLIVGPALFVIFLIALVIF